MQVTRRYFLQSSGALAAYIGIAPHAALALARHSRQHTAVPSGVTPPGLLPTRVNKGKTLVVVFLRGGADGLNLVIPHADTHYARLRKSIAVPGPASNTAAASRALDLDGYFGLHPRLAPLMKHFDSGMLRAAHAVGYAANTRSHFEEQDVWETGIIGNTVNSDGWVNRHLATSEGTGPVRAVAIGDTLPRILHGKAPAYAIRGVDDLTLPGADGNQRSAIKAGLEHAYCTNGRNGNDLRDHAAHTQNARDLLNQAANVTLDGIEQLRPLIGSGYTPAAPYPETGIARQLMQVARLVKAGVGLEVAEVDYGGWDTHQNQGAISTDGGGGTFGNLAGDLAAALDAFATDLADRMDDVLVVTLTDFGRTAAENGTHGTDHGWANCMFAMGGPVKRATQADNTPDKDKKVIGNWPGLAPDQLHEGRDLLHTTDFRDVLAELVRVHLGNTNLEAVLPGHIFKPVGLIG